MAMMKNRLTTRSVSSICEVGNHADGEGLYLNITRAGTKRWVFISQKKGSPRREKALGLVEDVTLAQARKKRDLLAKLGHAEQEGESKKGEGVPTFGEAAQFLIAQKREGWKRKKKGIVDDFSKQEEVWTNSLKTHAASIWHKPVDQVTTNDILDLLRPIWLTKHDTADRVRNRIESVLASAKVLGHRTGDNPAMYRGNLQLLLPKVPSSIKKRHFPAAPYAQVPAIYNRVAQRRGLSARALQLTILCAVRTGETIGAKWVEIDWNRAIWTVPAERMKRDQYAHRVPLSKPTLELLRTMKEEQAGISEFIFPGGKGPKYHLSNGAMLELLKEMDLADLTVHGFRSSFRDWAGDETEYAREIAEAALAHQVGEEVERAYRRGDALEKRRALMDDWGSFVTGRSGQAVPGDPLDE